MAGMIRPLVLAAVLAAPIALEAAPPVHVGFVRVIDGDTIALRMGGDEVAVRLEGIASPERDEPGGSAATAIVRALVEGHLIACAEMDRDRYGRVIGRCAMQSGSELNALIVAAGAARDCPRYSGGRYAAFEAAAPRPSPVTGYDLPRWCVR